MIEADVPAYAAMLKRSFNNWYRSHGWNRDRFRCPEADLAIYWEIYRQISPGHCVVAEEPSTGALMGACFYHPREHHVSLGIMSVDPAFFGRGVGRRLVNHIVEFTDSHGYDALRLVASGSNMDSFSLYNRAGLVPRAAHQDMTIAVPAAGFGPNVPHDGRVRDAGLADVPAIKELELEISGISRENDYRFCIANTVGCLHTSVFEESGRLGGFAVSICHPAAHIVGPAFARTEEQMLALILRELDQCRSHTMLLIVPMDKRLIVETLYRLGAVNIETHLFQVRGRFQPFAGVNLPSFLPETG